MAKVIIDTTKGSSQVEGDLNLEEFMNAVLATLSGMVAQVKAAAAKDEKYNAELFDRTLFDLYNERFSRFLEITFPECEMHPEITEQVLAKEAELIAAIAAEVDSDTADIAETKEAHDGV